MSIEENKAIVRRYFEGDGDGRDNVTVWDEICHPEMVLVAQLLGEPMQGLGPIKDFTAATHRAFSGFRIVVEDLIAEKDKVAARWRMSGTHSATLAIPGGSLTPS